MSFYRNFTGFLTPKVGGQDRQVDIKAFNYAEAEAMLAMHLRDDEFISSISQEFPNVEHKPTPANWFPEDLGA